MTLVVTPTAAGLIINTVHVVGAEQDPNGANNEELEMTVVLAASRYVYLPLVLK